jgi:gas vesicle protein
MTKNKLIAGVLTGVAAGVVVALILNTKKGRETGQEFLKKGNRLTDDLKGKFGEFIDQVQNRVQGILK